MLQIVKLNLIPGNIFTSSCAEQIPINLAFSRIKSSVIYPDAPLLLLKNLTRDIELGYLALSLDIRMVILLKFSLNIYLIDFLLDP